MDETTNADGLEASSIDALHQQLLQVGRPELGSALDGLRARMLATAGGLAPRTIGRYRIGRVIGSGAFGTVHEAEDPELDRRVAIKLLGVRSAKEAARVVREAQLLATISHPNVVQVFEVGTTDDGRAPYVVMELVEGPTLRKWLAEGPHPWREVTEVVLHVARGLWAAHQAGIIHRDLKPENVLMGRDGRPRVIDFGLARALGDAGAPDDSTLRSDAHDPAVRSGTSSQLTATGQVMGTPAYMAPEVFGGEHTPLSDQYALCVTLYEALFGERPFAAESPEALCRKLLAQEAELPADRRGVPRRVGAIVLRGLRRSPRERFGDLGQLIAALERSLRPRRWAIAIAGLAVIGASGSLLASMRPEPESPPPEVCVVGDAVWARLREQTTIPAALEDPLASYQRTWLETEQALCSAEGVIDWERRRCLDRGLRDVSALASTLADVDAKAVDPAKAMQGLPSAADCAVLVRDELAPPPASLELGPLEERLSRLRVLAATAQIQAGLELSGPLLAEMRTAGYVPLLVEASFMRARMLLLGSDYEGARAMFEETFFLAQQAGMVRIAARAAENLARLTGQYLEDWEAARGWVEHAELAFGRAGLDPLEQGVFLQSLAGLAQHEGDLVEATELLRRAVAAEVEAGHARDSFHAGLVNHLGLMLFLRNEYHAAIEALREAESIYAEHDGPNAPSRAAALDNIGGCLVNLGHHQAAYDHHRAVLAMREATLAADHVDLGRSYGNLARALMELGRYDEALVYIDRALSLFIARFGDEHSTVAMTYRLRGFIYERRGDRELAVLDFERAAPLFEAAGPFHADDVKQMREKIEALTTPAPAASAP
jgi:tetratricopeptide (TPR) repeat protein